MSLLPGLSITRPVGATLADDPVEYIMLQRPLQRVMAFTGRSIDDIVNDPIAKNEVLGFYKLHRQILRRSEVLELEKQWNSVG
jgi:hypothetical protein